jgi:hypothetical protein
MAYYGTILFPISGKERGGHEMDYEPEDWRKACLGIFHYGPSDGDRKFFWVRKYEEYSAKIG